jgi:hypothetical protein
MTTTIPIRTDENAQYRVITWLAGSVGIVLIGSSSEEILRLVEATPRIVVVSLPYLTEAQQRNTLGSTMYCHHRFCGFHIRSIPSLMFFINISPNSEQTILTSLLSSFSTTNRFWNSSSSADNHQSNTVQRHHDNINHDHPSHDFLYLPPCRRHHYPYPTTYTSSWTMISQLGVACGLRLLYIWYREYTRIYIMKLKCHFTDIMIVISLILFEKIIITTVVAVERNNMNHIPPTDPDYNNNNNLIRIRASYS